MNHQPVHQIPGVKAVVTQQQTKAGPPAAAAASAAATPEQKLLQKLSERVQAFQSLLPAEIGELLRASEKKKFTAGMPIVREGERGQTMYVILSGAAKVVKRLPDGQEKQLALLAPADAFGEMALVDGETRSADVIAAVDCILVSISALTINKGNQSVGLKIYRNLCRVLAERLRDTQNLVVKKAAIAAAVEARDAAAAQSEDGGDGAAQQPG